MGSAFRSVPRTGVIYVTTEAQKRGFRTGDPAWCNLGQGQPETGPLPGAPRARPRASRSTSTIRSTRRSPASGSCARPSPISTTASTGAGMPSQYSAENVSVSGGGRAALTRAAASLGHVNLGHFLPDYTAYEELLDIFKAFTAIPILLEGERGYAFSVDDLRREVQGRGLSALLLSNPCNPTGKHVRGDELGALGRDWRASSTARCCSTSSTRTTSGRRAGAGRRCPSRAPRATSRTSTAIRSCSSTASPRTGATPAGASRGRSGRKRVIEAVAERRLVPRRRRVEAAAARRHPAARGRARDAETNAIQAAFRDKRDRMLARPRAPRRRDSTAPPDGHVLRLGQGRRPARRRSTTAWASSAPRSTSRSSSCRASSSTSTRASAAASAPRASAATCASRSARRWTTLETALGRLETLAREAVTQTAMFGSGVFAAPVRPGSPKPA